jgi:VWFA-related protein
MRKCALIVALLAGAPFWRAALAQQQVFRTGVDLVLVDVSVVDRDGRPVGDLTPPDFAVTVDGKPRPIVSAQFMSLVRPEDDQRTETPLPSAPFSSNAETRAGRLVLLAVDQLHLQPGAAMAAAKAIEAFLDRLSRPDRVGLFAFPDNGPRISFTADHRRVRDALPRIAGRAQSPRTEHLLSLSEAYAYQQEGERSAVWNEVLNRTCLVVAPSNTRIDPACAASLAGSTVTMIDDARRDTARTLSTLRSLIQELGKLEGVKWLVLVTEALPIGVRSSRMEALGDVSWLASEASAARVSIYTLQLDRTFIGSVDASAPFAPVVTSDEEEVQASGLEALADYSRGALFKVTASADRAFERVALETSAYYLLGFEPQPGDRDGKRHQIDVKVPRRNVTVRSRTEFMVKGGKPETVPVERLATETLRSPVPATSLPVRVTTYSLRDARSDKLRLLIAAELGQGVTAPAELAAAYSLTDGSGTLVGESTDKETVKPAGAGERSCWPFTRSVVVSAGRYTLKIAAADPAGRAGSVEHPVAAQLHRGAGVEWSDLVLIDPTSPGSGEPRPTVQGMVESGAVGMYFEVYARGAGDVKQVGVTLEVASDAEGAPVVSRAAQLKRRGADWIAAETIPLPFLPPGDYLARADITVDGRTAGRVLRTLRVDTAAPAGAAGRSLAGAPRALAIFSDDRSFVRPFTRDSVLRGDVIDYFVGRMQAIGGLPSTPAVGAAIDQARAGRFAQVSTALASADANRLDVAFLRGLARFSAGDLEAAAAEFRASVRLSRDFLPGIFYLGACYAAGGKDREAAGAWKTALITESEAKIVFDVLADAFLRLGEGGKALEILEEARTKWSGDDLLEPRVAAALALSGKDAEAVATIAGYLKGHPDDEQSLFLAIRLIYESRVANKSGRSAAEDAQAIAEYARLYAAAKGAHPEIVSTWVKYVTKKK